MLQVPFFRPALHDEEIVEVVETLRSGWLTTGPRVKRFEQDFASAINGNGQSNGNVSSHSVYAVAVNSGTAALHLAVEALGLKPGQGVLVPTMTFAATAEVVRYQGAIPILVDCDPSTLNMDLQHAERTLADMRGGTPPAALPKNIRVVGVMPVLVGGLMMNIDEVKAFASRHDLWVVEDAAHAFPA